MPSSSNSPLNPVTHEGGGAYSHDQRRGYRVDMDMYISCSKATPIEARRVLRQNQIPSFLLNDFDRYISLDHIRNTWLNAMRQTNETPFNSLRGFFELLLAYQEQQDAMLRYLVTESRRMTREPVNLSPYGILFSEPSLDQGDIAHIHLLAPDMPPIPLSLIGRTVRVREGEADRLVAVEFSHRSDVELQFIAKIVLKEILKRRAKNAEDRHQ